MFSFFLDLSVRTVEHRTCGGLIVATTTIVEAKLEDLDIIIELWSELMQFHADRDERFETRETAPALFREHAKQYIEQDDGMLLLAYVDDQAAGYVTARCAESPPVFTGSEAVILEDMLIAKPFRRLGIGRMMTKRVIDWAQEQGRDNVQLQVAECNPEGIEFWREMGFREITRHMRYELGLHKGWDGK